MKKNSLHSSLFIIYCATAPINWLPSFPVILWFAMKKILFAILILMTIFQSSISREFIGYISPMVVVICSSIIGLFFGIEYLGLLPSLTSWWSVFQNYVYIILIMYVAYSIRGNDGYCYSLLWKSLLFTVSICMVSIFSYYTGLFDYIAPKELGGDRFKIVFSETAFSGVSTIYSSNLALLIPLILHKNYLLENGSKIALKKWIFIGVIILAQFICGGRGGFLASLVMVLIYYRSNIFYLVLLGGCAFFLFSYIPEDLYYYSFKIYIFENIWDSNGNLDMEMLNMFTANRISGYTYALELIDKGLFSGYGHDSYMILKHRYGYGFDVHNLWLRILLEGGIFYFFSVILMFSIILRFMFVRIKQKIKLGIYSKLHKNFIYSMLTGSLIISMLEPSFIIGSFQNSIFFWIIIGISLRKFSQTNIRILLKNS